MASLALSGAVALGGAAFAQTLGIAVNAPAEYTPGGTINVSFTIDRTDGGVEPDSDVTALGAEITLPTGWKLQRDADANCASTIDDNQTAGVNSTVQVKGSNQTYVDPPANTTCVALPTSGDVLEIFWIPESGGSGDPLPVDFPVVVTATFTVPGNNTGQKTISAVTKYRVLEGGEQTTNGSDNVEQGQGSGCTAPGDANDDGNGDIDDVQYVFDRLFPPLSTTDPIVNTECADICPGGVDIDDVQSLFNRLFPPNDPACP